MRTSAISSPEDVFGGRGRISILRDHVDAIAVLTGLEVAASVVLLELTGSDLFASPVLTGSIRCRFDDGVACGGKDIEDLSARFVGTEEEA
jgi:hypothetical protein